MAQTFLTRVKSKLYHPKPPPQPTQSQPESSAAEPTPLPEPPVDPILNDDDQAFLARVVSESLPAATATVDGPVSSETHYAQMESLEEAKDTPLPTTPGVEGRRSMSMSTPEGEGGKAEEGKWTTKKMWGMLRRESTKDTDKDKGKGKERRRSSHGKRPSQDATREESKPEDAVDSEVEREQRDMADVLEKLNLASLDNRVFSVNEETRILLEKFKLILRDLLNGVPESYKDLENLFKNRDQQIEDLYNSLPGFLQKLVAQLPESLTPELLATVAAKAEKSGAMNVENAEKVTEAAGKIKGFSKDWATKPAAILGFLRSIMAYLRVRFPALLGMNALWSLALCLLLLSLWYCHKRGREVRLEKEAAETAETAETAGEGESGIGSSEQIDAQQNVSSIDDAEIQPPATPADGPAAAEDQTGADNGAARQAKVDSAFASLGGTRGKSTRQKVEPYEGT